MPPGPAASSRCLQELVSAHVPPPHSFKRENQTQTCSNPRLCCPLQPGGRSREAQLRPCPTQQSTFLTRVYAKKTTTKELKLKKPTHKPSF